MDLLEQLHTGLGDRYDVERELGGGAMSRVFLARDRQLGRLVAIKTLTPELVSALSMERFRREIEVCARLQHPHILPLLSADEEQDIPYFITPYIQGESLRDRLARDERLPLDVTLRVARDVADALEYAHSEGVVHRDIKPGNILLAGDHAIVTDFGVAKVVLAAGQERAGDTKLTGIGISLGTPAYMAPEQAVADPSADHRVDIYSLGAVMYEMLCGHPPFAGRSSARLIAAQVREEPVSIVDVCPKTPPHVAALVMRCLAKDPAQRPQRASEIVRAIEAGGPPPPPRGTTRRFALVAATAALVVGVGGFSLGPFLDRDARSTALTILRRRPAVLRPGRVVVAPFRNETGDTSLSHLGGYAADNVAEGLLRLNRFVVVDSRTTMIADSVVTRIPWPLRLVGRDRALAREAGASVLISGRYYRDARTLRFQAQISDVETGKLLHALPEVNGPAGDARAVVAALQRLVVAAMWQGSDTTVLLSIGDATDPPSVEAYTAMQTGLIAFLRFDPGFADRLRRAEALDSTYATPVVLQAMGLYRGLYDRAAAAIERADRLRDRMAPAEHALLEHARAQLNADPEAALRHAQQAMTLLPASLEVPLLVAGTALQLQRPSVALAALNQTDPDRGSNLVSPYYWRHRAEAEHQLGNHKRALETVREGLRRFPKDDDLAKIDVGELADLGRVDDIRHFLDDCQPGLPQLRVVIAGAAALTMNGRQREARAIADEWIDRPLTVDAVDGRSYAQLRIELFALAGGWDRVRELASPLVASDTGLLAAWDWMALGVAASHLGDRKVSAAADDSLRRLAGRWDFGITNWWRARIAAHEGDEVRAFQHLSTAIEKSVRLHSTTDSFDRDAWLSPLLGRPAFERLTGQPMRPVNNPSTNPILRPR